MYERMRAILICGVLLMMAGCATTEPAAAEPELEPEQTAPAAEAVFTISYHDTFTEVDVRGDELSYSWMASPKGAGNLAGPESYVSRGTSVTLSPQQKQRLREWAREYGVFRLAGPDRPGNPEIPPAAFHHEFEVVIGDRRHSLSWTGASAWDDWRQEQRTRDAVDALVRLAVQSVREKDPAALQ